MPGGALLVVIALTLVLGLGASTSQAQPPEPTVNAGIDYDNVWLQNWAPTTSVTVTIGGVDRTVTTDPAGNAFLDRATHGQDIVAGMVISATDGAVTKTLSVADVRITSVDMSTDTVSGTAPAGAVVHVQITRWPDPPLGQADVTAAADGSWQVNPSVDITYGQSVDASVADPDGDTTAANRYLQTPWVGAWIDTDSVGLNSWTPGSIVTLHVGPVERTVTVDGSGNAWLDRQAVGQDIVPGMTITASDGALSKTLVVANLRITGVDLDADTVTGVAPPNAHVYVPINQWPGGQLAQSDAIAGPDGSWTVDFHGTVDLRLGVGIGVGAITADDDGDNSFAGRQLVMPTVNASPDGDGVWVSGWPPGSSMTVHVGDAVQTVTVDGFGNAFIPPQAHGQDVVPGLTITASDGAMTKTLVVVDLHVTVVDRANDTVSGTAPAGTVVQVQVSNDSGQQRQADVTADASGHWSASFAGSFDVAYGVDVSAKVSDADLDTTFAGTFLQLPTVGTFLGEGGVSLMNWTPGSEVTVRVGEVVRNVTVNDQGSAYLDPQMLGLTVGPGMTITATDGEITKTLDVPALEVTSVDLDADSVSGIAPHGAVVNVHIFQPNAPSGHAQVNADGNGHWSVSFAGSLDLVYGMNVNVGVTDPDGDGTNAGMFLQRPWVGAWITEDGISLHQWPPGSSVTVTVAGVSRNVSVDEHGSAWVDCRASGLDVVPGLTIMASDGETTATLVVADVRVTSVNAAADTVGGTAGPGETVGVALWQPPAQLEPPLGWMGTTADQSGNWTVDFSGIVDLTPTMAVNATIGNPDIGGITNYDWFGVAPTVEAGGPYTVAEGSKLTLQGSGTGGQAPLAYQWLGGSGQLDDSAKATARFTGLDDGSVPLTLVVTDAAGLSGSDDTTVTVTNRAPVVSPFVVNTSSQRRLELGAAFVDAGRLDTHTALVRWGDNSQSAGTVKEKLGVGAVVAAHQYARKGTYMVTLTVRDDDGGEQSVQRQVTVR